jgi:ribosome-associated protein
VATLQERLGEDIKVLDVRDVSTITNYFVLATGTSTPHLRSLAGELDQVRKQNGIKGTRTLGGTASGWVVVDFGEVVVHLMTPELREFYALEKLWSDAKTVDPSALTGD